MKIHYLCEHYPGEWILSLAARTKRAISMDSALCFVRSLFGTSKISLGLALVENRSNLERSLKRLSLLNFITSFVPGKLKRADIAKLVDNATYTTAAYELGRAGSRRLRCQFLRYCVECARTQIERFGEPYWLRLPQIRGIEYCPIHKVAYVESPVSRQRPGDLHPLSSIYTKYFQPPEPGHNKEIARYQLGEAAAGLLDAEPSWDTEWINQAWARLLREYGATATSLGLARSLSHDLRARYGEDYLRSAGCDIGATIENSWLTRFIRNPSQETDPLRHLLILGLGQNTIADLTNAACRVTCEPTEGIGSSRRLTHRIPTVAVRAKVAPRNLTWRRTSWLFALKQSGSQTKARLLEPATYAWLRRNDYRWLMENRPPLAVTSNRRPRVNWSAREAVFVARLAPARERILKKMPPQRCGTQLLAREIGAEDFLRHIRRMPILEAQLRSLSEDKVEFATRRIVAIYRDNKGKGSYSQIRKLAGVRSSTASLPAVRDYISRRCPEIY